MIRVFLGIPFSSRNAQFLISSILQKNPHFSDSSTIRCVAQQNYHLTLHFLGDINAQQISPLIEKINQDLTSNPVEAFDFSIDKIDLFPHPNSHSHLIAAYVVLSDDLLKLYALLKASIIAVQLTVEQRAYKPHITMARLHHRIDSSFRAIDFAEPYSAPAKEFVLYQSKPTSAGSLYIPLHRFKL